MPQRESSTLMPWRDLNIVRLSKREKVCILDVCFLGNDQAKLPQQHRRTSRLAKKPAMPPKKATEEVKDNVVAFGRVRKNLKMGCVGLPNVGKSSLFNLLTKQSAAAENYPFCTIEPNEARCPVPDARYVSPR